MQNSPRVSVVFIKINVWPLNVINTSLFTFYAFDTFMHSVLDCKAKYLCNRDGPNVRTSAYLYCATKNIKLSRKFSTFIVITDWSWLKETSPKIQLIKARGILHQKQHITAICYVTCCFTLYITTAQTISHTQKQRHMLVDVDIDTIQIHPTTCSTWKRHFFCFISLF